MDHHRFASVRRAVATALTSAAFLLAVVPPASAGDPVRVKGTDLTLEPPEGFTPAARFAGFEKADAGAAIQVNVLPGPVSKMKEGMTAENLSTRGMTLLSSSTEKVDGRDALLLGVSQRAQGADFLKWLLVTGDESSTAMVVASFPKSEEKQLGDAMRKAVLSVRRETGAPADPQESLPFRLTPPTKLPKVVAAAASVMLLEPGKSLPVSRDDAYLIAGASVRAQRIDDLEAFTKARLRTTATVEKFTDVETRTLKVDGLDACEATARCTSTGDGSPRAVLLVIVVADGGYWIFQGLAPASRADAMFPVFREAVESARRPQPKAPAPEPPTLPAK